MSPRVGTHTVALMAVIGLTLSSAFTRPAGSGLAIASVASESSETGQTLPAQRALDLDTLAAAPAAAALTQGADQRQALAFNPRLGLPRWLRTVKDAPLWSSSDATATATTSLPAGTTFVKPLGPLVDNRVQVYFPGDEAHPAARAWVDTTTVEPSGVPAWVAPPEAQPPLAPSALPAAPQRLNDGAAPDTTAVHIAIVDDASGELIYGEAPYTEVPQASTTKIATTIVALEREPDLSRRIKVTISASAMVARDGSSTMGIEPGRSLSLDTLLHGMMLPSGNDAAEQVAVALADSREQYVEWMNQEAAALGLKDTHFVNPSGMDASGHYSSAYDMAMLARYAMHNATFRDLAATSHYTSDGFPMQNLNRFLDLYPGADGVKIGFTDAALKTIVASATHDNHRVYISLMRSQDLVGDSTRLFNWVWDTFNW
ncbi:MAG: serine hydrolase [Chloroflexi bacterium]|nr:serine hydrolase [Chloroflexota bacterium]